MNAKSLLFLLTWLMIYTDAATDFKERIEDLKKQSLFIRTVYKGDQFKEIESITELKKFVRDNVRQILIPALVDVVKDDQARLNKDLDECMGQNYPES